MNFASALSEINWLSVVVATLASFAIGGLWYSPILFGKAWLAELKLTTQDMSQSNMLVIFGSTFILNFIAAIVLDMFIGKDGSLVFGLIAGLLVGVAWVATSLGVNYLFSRKSLRLFMIDAFYFIVYFAVMGIILGAW